MGLRSWYRKRILDQISFRERYPDIKIGRHTYESNLRVDFLESGATLSIGSFCSIGGNVKIFLGGEHRSDWVTTYPFCRYWQGFSHISGHPRTKGDVSIGNDVWIGAEALIMSGVTIGDGAIVGARTVVTRDVPPYGIVVGNPARLIRKRFSDAQISELLALKWWEESDDALKPLIPLLQSNDIDQFIAAFKQRR